MKLEQIFDYISDLLRSGRGAEARSAILTVIREAKVPRGHRVRLAYLARQANLQEKAIGLLHRVVRPRSRSSKATDEEKAEYGMALAEIGASREAMAILTRLDVKKLPRIFRPLTTAYFRRWEWDAAIPLIEAYLSRTDLEKFTRLGMELRLGMAFLHGLDDHVRSRAIFERVIAETPADQYPVIHQESALFMVQSYYLQQEYGKALERQKYLESLAGAEREFAYFPLITRQWGALTRFRATRDKEGSLAELRRTRDAFLSERRWINAHACDYYGALCTQSRKALLHMYYSVPFPANRRKLLQGFGLDERAIAPTYDWVIAGGARGRTVLDVVNGIHGAQGSALKAGQLPQRLLRALTSNFYKAPEAGDLFEQLYPNEFFNPLSSPHRIHEAVRRLRLWLRNARIPLEIRESRESYHFHATRPFALRLTLDPGPAAAEAPLAAKLLGVTARIRERFGDAEFSSLGVAELLASSRNSAITSLTEGVAAGLIDKLGDGRVTRYRLRPAAHSEASPES